MDKKIIDELNKFISNKENLLIDEPMKKHTSFKAGGPADIYIYIETQEELKNILKYLRENSIPYFILGNGSNLLVRDGGIEGVVLSMEKYTDITVDSGTETLTAKSGNTLGQVAKAALENSLAGLEFASGIPGSLGGAVFMNAGAYGEEIKDVIISATVLTEDGEIKRYGKNELGLRYRNSNIQRDKGIVLEAVFKLQKGDKAQIREKMRELNKRRKDKQPLEYGSAGSTFKRPEGYFAGKLIEDSGLKGYRYKDAGVSEKHAGFVINYGNATASDIIYVIEHVRKKVYDNFGIHLELEVRMTGRDKE